MIQSHIDMHLLHSWSILPTISILEKDLRGEISGFYRHKGINNLTKMEPIYQMSFGVQKQVMKGKGTVRLNVRDPFAWQKFEGVK